MTDITTHSAKSDKETGKPSGKQRPAASNAAGDTSKGVERVGAAVTSQAALASLPAKTTRGQKHIAPLGRHSQQSHRRAEERAAALGSATAKEQHAQDRDAIKAGLNRDAARRVQQQASKPTVLKAQPAEPEKTEKSPKAEKTEKSPAVAA